LPFGLISRENIDEAKKIAEEIWDLLPDDDDEGLPDEKTCEKVSENSSLYGRIFTSSSLLFIRMLGRVHILYKLINSK